MRHLQFPLTVLLFFAIGLAGFRVVLQFTETWHPEHNLWTKQRARESLAHLRSLPASNERLVLFLGSSEIESGFSPLAFDDFMFRNGNKSLSYNLAVRNLAGMFPMYLTRIEHEIRKAGLRPSLILINIAPWSLTKKAHESRWKKSRSHDLPAVYFDKTIWRDIPESSSDKAFLWIEKYFFGERTLAQIGFYVARRIQGLIDSPGKGQPEVSALWYSPQFHPKPAWNRMDRGNFFWGHDTVPDLVKEKFEELKTDEAFDASVEALRRCCDFGNLNVNEAEVQETAKALARFKDLADRVILIRMPENPRYQRSLESRQAHREISEQLAREAGVAHWTISDAENFQATDFFDVLHFTPQGRLRFARILASRLRFDSR